MHHVLISKTETSEEENPETLSNPEAGSVFLLFSLGRKELATMVLWVFGYGSLIWNPGFDFDQKILGYIKDYRRVFDLACIDHRGTPEHPARTLTVESKKGALCWGIAYCVRGGLEKERMAMEYLRMRECEYDLETYVDFYTDQDQDQEEDATGTPVVTRTLMFCSTPCKVSNKYYLGTAPLGEMATQIATAIGPCGNNREYLFNLEKALFRIGHEEDSITELANEVRKVMIRFKEKKMIGAHLALNSHLSPVPHILNTSETIFTTDSV